MRLSDFDYVLPPELIAQEPPAERDGARMLVVHRADGCLEDRHFRDLPEYLAPGDCLVLNDSRVLPSRLLGEREGGGAAEVLLLEPLGTADAAWRALVRPGKKLGIGARVHFDDSFQAEIIARGERGERTVRLSGSGDMVENIERLGPCPCHRTSRGPTLQPTANDTRRFMPASAVPWPRQLPDCILLPKFWSGQAQPVRKSPV